MLWGMLSRAADRFLVLLALLGTLACAACSTDAPPAGSAPAAHGAPWFQGPYEDALAEARATRKLVFIDFWASWCPPCKRLERETFPHPDVQAELARMVSLSIDAESPAGIPLAEKYRVGGYPTLLVLGSDGAELGRFAGFLPPEGFLAKLAEIRARAKG
jgi:thiol:disulfide interchange protein